ncbi:MAG TPA: hypothetical protein VGJ67_07305 [Actinomycetota bacterium]|jgi:hypothetical protein
MTIRPAYSSWPEYNRRLRDVYHCAELNETLSVAGLPQINLWDWGVSDS